MASFSNIISIYGLRTTPSSQNLALNKAATGSSFDYSGLRRLRSGRVLDSPALSVFTHAARELEGCAKLLGDASRCR